MLDIKYTTARHFIKKFKAATYGEQTELMTRARTFCDDVNPQITSPYYVPAVMAGDEFKMGEGNIE